MAQTNHEPFTAPTVDDAERARTARHQDLPGFEPHHQERLRAAHVVLLGVGGLGCPIAQQLAAVGVGRLTLIDSDVVDVSNLQRQVLYRASDIGKLKAPLAAERIAGLQPGIQVRALTEHVTADNAADIFAGADLVIEATDNFAAKYLASDVCARLSLPHIWGTVLRHGGQAALWHAGADTPDGRGVGLRDLYPAPPEVGGPVDVSPAGVFGVTTSMVGGLMATLAIAHLVGPDSTLHSTAVPGTVYDYHAFPPRLRTFRVTAAS